MKSFRDLVGDVRALQRCLRKVGVRPGHVVGVQVAGGYAFVVWDLALTDMGVVPHVFPEEWSLREMQQACAKRQLAFFASAQAGTLILPDSEDDELLCDYVSVLQSARRNDEPDALSEVYSSGTTGSFKGLSISRRGAEALATEFVDTFSITDQDRYLFFLPFSHFQQRLTVYACLYYGVSVMHTPHTHVFHDIARFKPTFMIGPPVFYETALGTLIPNRNSQPAEADLAARLGGEIRFMIAGMAPIRQSMLETYQSHKVPLLEAYGITEVGLVAWNTPGDNRIGTVGKPLKNHRVKLSPEGEILVRADHPLSSGYFDADDGEAERTFLPSGYIATGDIGSWDGDRLVFKGRRKDIIVTNAGAKFHPSELEQRLLRCSAIKQCVVVNDLLTDEVVAVLVVDDPHDPDTAATVDRLVQDINDTVPSYKNIRRTVLTRTRFTLENGMLTRTLKSNRAVISQHYCADEPYRVAVSA